MVTVEDREENCNLTCRKKVHQQLLRFASHDGMHPFQNREMEMSREEADEERALCVEHAVA